MSSYYNPDSYISEIIKSFENLKYSLKERSEETEKFHTKVKELEKRLEELESKVK